MKDPSDIPSEILSFHTLAKIVLKIYGAASYVNSDVKDYLSSGLKYSAERTNKQIKALAREKLAIDFNFHLSHTNATCFVIHNRARSAFQLYFERNFRSPYLNGCTISFYDVSERVYKPRTFFLTTSNTQSMRKWLQCDAPSAFMPSKDLRKKPVTE